MLLTDTQIEEVIASGDLVIEGFTEDYLQGASYDLRVGSEALMSGEDRPVDLSREGTFTIKPGQFAIVNTYERIAASPIIAGRIGVKSTYTRKGLVFLAGLQIDPGFDGYLVLGLYNASPRKFVLEYKEPFCSVEFHKLNAPAQKLHDTDSDLRNGHLPRLDKEYLRALETETLTEMSRSVRELTQGIGVMSKVMYVVLIPLVIGLYVAMFAFFMAGAR